MVVSIPPQARAKVPPGYLGTQPACLQTQSTELIFTLAGALSASFIRQLEQQLQYSYLCTGP